MPLAALSTVYRSPDGLERKSPQRPRAAAWADCWREGIVACSISAIQRLDGFLHGSLKRLFMHMMPPDVSASRAERSFAGGEQRRSIFDFTIALQPSRTSWLRWVETSSTPNRPKPMHVTAMPSAPLARRLRSSLWCQKQVVAGDSGRRQRNTLPCQSTFLSRFSLSNY